MDESTIDGNEEINVMENGDGVLERFFFVDGKGVDVKINVIEFFGAFVFLEADEVDREIGHVLEKFQRNVFHVEVFKFGASMPDQSDSELFEKF